ncbi:MAG: class I SAM-dependent methyltransferase [Actinomycetota bacterium]|nr:class I SAM-dependent methyltransferase [Actinomycetota bacterium]
MNYGVAYRVGFHPWEDAATHPPFTEKFAELLDREETGREQPYGTALDLGTGSGIWGVELAKRGWQVTGVDNVAKALERAHERVGDAGVEMHLVEGDVTDLGASGITPGYRLVLDTGTFHGLGTTQRQAMAQQVDSIAAADATVLLIAWEPKRRGPFPRGASQGEIEQVFPGWSVTDAGASNFEAPKPIELLLRPDEHWYRLRRRG